MRIEGKGILFVLVLLVVFSLSLPAYSSSGLELIDFDIKVLDVSYDTVNYSWKMIVKNHTTYPMNIYMEISFLDEEGYKLFYTNGVDTIGAGELITFTDTALEDIDLFSEVKNMRAKVNSW